MWSFRCVYGCEWSTFIIYYYTWINICFRITSNIHSKLNTNCLDFVLQILEMTCSTSNLQACNFMFTTFHSNWNQQLFPSFLPGSRQTFNGCVSILVTPNIKVIFLKWNYICNLQELPLNAVKHVNLNSRKIPSCKIFLELHLLLFIYLCLLSRRVVIIFLFVENHLKDYRNLKNLYKIF